MGAGGEVAADIQGIRLNAAAPDGRCKDAVGLRIHADRADVHKTDRQIGLLGIGFGKAPCVVLDGDIAAGGDDRVFGAGLAAALHLGPEHVDFRAEAGGRDAAGGGAAQNGLGTFTPVVVKVAVHLNGGGVHPGAVELRVLLRADGGGQGIDHGLRKVDGALRANVGQRSGRTVGKDIYVGSFDR